ncbi:MAG: hypothetical protein JJ894_11555 [Dinoroseobacter sp.]|nr:hypothetical protein [Dinoroseobacter sp.]
MLEWFGIIACIMGEALGCDTNWPAHDLEHTGPVSNFFISAADGERQGSHPIAMTAS